MIEADWGEDSGLEIKNSKVAVTEEQKTRLIDAIKESIAEGWNVEMNHTFFLLNNISETDFKKISPGGIFRVRYFNLNDVLGVVSDDIITLANDLKIMTWE